MNGGDGQSLRSLFTRAVELFHAIEDSDLSSSDAAFQAQVAEAVGLLRDCKQRVQALSLFSDNEIVDDISTADLRFILVDAYLAEVTLKINDGDRLAVIEDAEAHLKAYLRRLEEYQLMSKADLKHLQTEMGEIRQSADARRTEKVAQFKREKATKMRLKELADMLANKDKKGSQGEDMDEDEIERDLVLVTVDLFVHKAIASLRMIKDEKEMLEIGRKRREAMETAQGSASGSSGNSDRDRIEPLMANRKKLSELTGPLMDPQGKPLRPFVIASQREALLQGVFRPGHNLPTMTVEEYLEREIERGNFLSGGTERPEKVDPDDNDEVALEAARLKALDFDNFKDDNPRGWGNRHRKG
ncbi:TAP42-like protein [Entophlyctis helioformis]|nr:TAP42-like protein [Entophlyctis helioformis]